MWIGTGNRVKNKAGSMFRVNAVSGFRYRTIRVETNDDPIHCSVHHLLTAPAARNIWYRTVLVLYGTVFQDSVTEIYILYVAIWNAEVMKIVTPVTRSHKN